MDSFNIIWAIFSIFSNSQILNTYSIVLPSNQNSYGDTQAEIRCNTHGFRVGRIKYIWTINDFSVYEKIKDHDHPLDSPKFSDGTQDSCDWYLSLIPNGGENKNDTISLFLYQHPDKRVEKVLVKIDTYRVLNNRQEEVWSSKGNLIYEFTPDNMEGGWGRYNLLRKDQFFKDHLLHNDTLILCVEFRYYIQCQSMNSNIHRPLNTTASPEPNIIGNDIAKNLEFLFENSLFADIVISVNGKKINAHKNILAARSTVFADLVRYPTKTDELGRTLVIITDMDEEVTEEILRYIYTGKCKNLAKLAKDLLVAAKKYALAPLREICAQMVGKTFSAENAVDLLVFADRHKEDELRSQVIEFIVDEFNKVVNTEAWKYLVSSNHKLVNEICQALAQGLSDKNKRDKNNFQTVCSF